MKHNYIKLKRVGFWKQTTDVPPPTKTHSDPFMALAYAIVGAARRAQVSLLAKPQDAVDTHWGDTPEGRVERGVVLAHLKSGRRHEAYFGYHTCLMCGSDAGYQDLTDGTYVWPEGYAHYIEAHGVKPPQDFIEHVLFSGAYAMYGAPW